MSWRAFVTGGAGFIGSALVLELLAEGWAVEVYDALAYAAAPGTVEAIRAAGAGLTKGDVRGRAAIRAAIEAAAPDTIFHLAAETHVDRSIDAADDFVTTNLLGTFEVLEAARARRDAGAAVTMVHVSTDEVFGSLSETDPPFSEATAYDPSSPYSASKAGSDHLARAWARTYGLDVRVSNCSNNYGPRQFPEKLIPLMILNAIENRTLPVYGDGSNRRDWLHVEDHARALRLIAERGRAGRTYCVGGGAERSNLDVVQSICDLVDAAEPKAGGAAGETDRRALIDFVKDRPGHDWRYAIDASRAAAELGWTPARNFEDGLAQTVAWYRANPSWWRPLRARYDGVRLGGPT